jgi:hypothetical protein
MVLLPFELLGQFLSFFGRFVVNFLLSPWGLIVPFTLLALLFFVTQITKTNKMIAASYANELATCDEAKIPVLIDNLIQLGDYGVPHFVSGLVSPREPVFIACCETIRSEMEHWEQLPEAERIRKYQIFSESLLNHVTEFGFAAQNETVPFVRKILRQLVAAKKTSQQLPDSHKVARNCERFLLQIGKQATSKTPEMSSEEVRPRFNQRNFDATLMTAQGKPFQPHVPDDESQSETLAANILGDTFSVSRAERLYAYHQSPQFQKQSETPYHRNKSDLFIPAEIDSSEMLASTNSPQPAKQLTKKTTPLSNHLPKSSLPESSLVEPEGKIARNYLEQNAPQTDFIPKSDELLPSELRTLPLEKIPNLTTIRLMQLLHHLDERYVSEARKTLIARDGFQDSHLKLAYRLFHPSALVRIEIVPLLSNTTGIRPDVWLSVLLGDPDNEVRYRAASFLATAGDPTMQRLVIDKGKHDSDTRIVNLADQLLEQQRRKIRR